MSTDKTLSLCPLKVLRILPLSILHSFILLSSEAETINFPSWLKATELTAPVCPSKVFRGFSDVISHSIILWSAEPESK